MSTAPTATTAIKNRCATASRMSAAMTPALAAARRNSKNATAHKLAMSNLNLFLLGLGGLLLTALAAYALLLWRGGWAPGESQAAAAKAPRERGGGVGGGA